MKFSVPLITIGLILCAGSLFAQAPNISYASSSASLLINVAVGTAPNPSLTVTNSGGTIPTAIFTASTFAGSTSRTAGRNNATGTAATFSGPKDITVDGSGNFYIADKANNEIRKMTSGGVVTLLAGSSTGASGRANATGSSATFNGPSGITNDGTNLYVADSTNNEIRKIVISSGAVTLLAGSSTGASGTTNNNTGSSARFNHPVGIVYSSSATAMYVADYTNNEIRKVTTAGAVTLLAGSSTGASGLTNGTTTAARFNHPVGVAVDASGNLYVADEGNNQIRKVTSVGVVTLFAGNSSGTAGSTDGTGSGASFNKPTGITADALGNLYVYDRGTGLLRQIVISTGVVTTVAGSGTPGYTDGVNTVAQFRGGGLIADASNNIFMADYLNNNVREIIQTTSFTISPALPTGLTFDTTTGEITGTPTVSSAPADYTITAYNESGNNATTLNLNVYSKKAWDGSSSTTWATSANWTPSGAPATWDQVTIGTTTTYTNLPTISSGTVTIGSLVMGTSDNGTSPSITVNGTLNVTNDITYQSDANSNTHNSFIATLAGSGTISATNLNILATTSLTTYTLKLTSSITNLNLSGGISLTGNYASSKVDNSTLTISGGTVTATALTTSNDANALSTSTLAMTGGTLNFTDPAALAGLSANGTNTFTLSSGSTIGYTGSADQTIYTSTAITGLPGGISYKNLTLGGTGIKTAPSDNLNVAGNFTNSLANDVSNYADLSAAAVIFNGTTQAIAGGSGTGTSFTNVTFNGGGTKTLSGTFSLASDGVLTMGNGSTTLAAGSGLLTLKSDATSSAAVVAIPSGSSITGSVNVETYISGGQSYSRGYRLLSSPVSLSSGNLIYPNLDFIKNGTYTSGTTGTGGGFSGTGNPSIYLYRQDVPPDFSTFISGNSRGVSKINNTNPYNFDINTDGSGFTIPAGNGVLMFYRGDPLISNPTLQSTIATPNTFVSTGYLNQGNIPVKDWFTPASSTLSYTPSTTVSGFNLLGNPYASSIDWDVMTGGTNIGTTIWVYNFKTKAYATYIQGHSGVGTGITGNTANIIPSGQGFYIQVPNSTPASFTFLESYKTSTQVPAADRVLSTAPVSNTALKYLRVKLFQDALNLDDALVFFKNTASPFYVVNEDARYRRGNNDVALSTKVGNENLAINELPFGLGGQKIALNATISATGTYQLSLPEIKNIPGRYKIWLMDAYKKDSLKIQNSNTTYTFNANVTDTSSFGSKRFSIVLRENPDSAYRLVSFTANKAPSSVNLAWKTENDFAKVTFTIERSNDGGATYNIIGTVPSNGGGTYTFIDNSPKSGANLYRLKQEDFDVGLAYSEVVTIAFPLVGDVAKNMLRVYPNPATSNIKVTIVEFLKALPTQVTSNYIIDISNSTGNTIKTITTPEPEKWQGDINSFAPGIYFIRIINNDTKTIVGNSKFVKL